MPRSLPQSYEMSSSRLPSGSRKSTLVPSPRAPRRRTGPSSTATSRGTQVIDRALDPSRPGEAQIASAGCTGSRAWQMQMQYACADAYRIDDPHDYLTHDDLPVDEHVWLTPDDVAQGKDTVVNAALRWINSQTP